MPNLINVLRGIEKKNVASEQKQPQTDEERKEELQRVLKGGSATGGRGMEWGTCLVFSCEKDCCVDENAKDTKECWAEELVLVQWEE